MNEKTSEYLQQNLKAIADNSSSVGVGGQGGTRKHHSELASSLKAEHTTIGEVNFETEKLRVVILSNSETARYEQVDMLTKLFRNKWVTADGDPHLIVDNAICKTCPGQWCLHVCPSQRYTRDADGLIHVDYEGCFECGTCRVACLPGGVYWKYPIGGHGVCYREG